MNKNKNKIYQNLWDTAKEVLRGTFIVLTTYIKKRKKSQISSLIFKLAKGRS